MSRKRLARFAAVFNPPRWGRFPQDGVGSCSAKARSDPVLWKSPPSLSLQQSANRARGDTFQPQKRKEGSRGPARHRRTPACDLMQSMGRRPALDDFGRKPVPAAAPDAPERPHRRHEQSPVLVPSESRWDAGALAQAWCAIVSVKARTGDRRTRERKSAVPIGSVAAIGTAHPDKHRARHGLSIR